MIVITEKEAEIILDWCSYVRPWESGRCYDKMLTEDGKALYCRLNRAAPRACHQEFCALKQCQFERRQRHDTHSGTVGM